MKRTDTESTIFRQGIASEQLFTIAAKGKAFEILSSGLYTDPMLAVVRELCCNARDSHIANGNPDEPFNVHLPNDLEPFFEVRDFGLGLSDHDVFHIFSTYFESTKDDSDEFIGCLGLGSKSPFSYANAFEVTSYFDGTKSTYSMYKNEEGIPSVALMSSSDTDSVNGLSVKLAIKSEDHQTFADKLAHAIQYFDTQPAVTGSHNFTPLPQPEHTISGTDWFIYSSRFVGRPTTLTVVQGGVGYKVDTNQLSKQLSDRDRMLLEAVNLVITFPIGMIDIPPSREEVRYDKTTVSNISTRIKEIRVELTPLIESGLVDIPNDSVWDAYTTIRLHNTTTFRSPMGMEPLLDQGAISNPHLRSYFRDQGRITFNMGFPDDVGAVSPSGLSGLQHFNIRTYNRRKRNALGLGRFETINKGNITVSPNKTTEVVLLDVRFRAIMRLTEYVQRQNIDVVYVIVPNDYKTHSTDVNAIRELAAIKLGLGHPNVNLVSSMPIDRAGTIRNTAPKIHSKHFYKYVGKISGSTNYWGNPTDSNVIEWEKIRSDATNAPKSGLYFMLSAHTHIRVGDSKSLRVDWQVDDMFEVYVSQLLTLINDKKGTSYTIDDVYGAQPMLANHSLVKSPDWTNMFQLANECLDPVIERMNLAVQLGSQFTDFMDISKHPAALHYELSKLPADSMFRKVVQPLLAITKRDRQLVVMIPMARSVRSAVTPYKSLPYVKQKDIQPLYSPSDLYTHYPMLQFTEDIEYGNCKNTDKVIFEYIKTTDNGQ